MSCAKLEDWLLIQRRASRRARSGGAVRAESAAASVHARRLRQGSLWTRYGAALALEELGAGARVAFSELIAALRDDDNPSVRRVAARALGKLGAAARGARGPLEDARRDPSGLVRQAASSALRTLGR